MSFLTAAYLMQTYGPLLTEHELSEVLKLEPGTVRNKRARGGLGIPYTQWKEFSQKAAPLLDAAFFLCKSCAVRARIWC